MPLNVFILYNSSLVIEFVKYFKWFCLKMQKQHELNLFTDLVFLVCYFDYNYHTHYVLVRKENCSTYY